MEAAEHPLFARLLFTTDWMIRRMIRFQTVCFLLLIATLSPLTAAEFPSGRSWAQAHSSVGPVSKGLGNVAGTFLTSGDVVTFGLPEVTEQTVFVEGYRIEVPSGGHDRLEIDVEMLTPGADLALFVRFGQDVEVVGGNPVADYFVDDTLAGEQLVITPGSSPALQPGVYYIGLGLITTNTSIKARITATVSGGPPVPPVGVRLINDVPAAISIPAVQSPTVVAGGLGFRIDVPDDASRLRIDAELDNPDADFQLYVRYGFDVQLFPNGLPLADQFSPGLGPSQTVSVTLNTTPPITGGTYWIGFGLQSVATPFEGTIVASFDVEGQTPPTIELSTASLDFNSATGIDPPAQQFTVRNAGDGTLDYLISADQGWVQLSVTAGSSTGEADPVNVSINTAGLGGGVHSATITVTRGDGTEPVEIQVTLVLSGEGPPVIGLTISELIIDVVAGTGAGVKAFTLTNTGGSVLNYQITTNVPWLEVSPTEGASSGEADPITAIAEPTGLGLGTFMGEITIRDDGAGLTATIPVTFNVFTLPPQPTATVEQLTFEAAAGGAPPAPQLFSIGNSGSGELNYIITTSELWLMVDPDSGSVTTAVDSVELDTITVTVSPLGLTEGTHQAQIVIAETTKGDEGPAVVDVTLTVIGDLTPFIRTDGVVNGATFAGPELEAHASAPGSIVSIFGDNMVVTTESAAGIPLPTDLGGVRVEFDDGVNDPMEAALFVAIRGGDFNPPLDFDQINAQMPWGLDTSSGFVTATVFTGEKAVSPPRLVPVAEASPGLFTFQFGSGLAAVQNFKLSEEDDVIQLSIAQPEGSVCPALGIPPESCTIVDQPAPVGGVIVLFANGLGLLDGTVETGNVPPAGPPLLAVKEVRVFFGEPGNQVQGTTLFAGLQQFLVGLNQINVIVPDVQPGDAVPIQVEVECEDGTTIRSRSDVTIAVRPAP